MAMFQFGGIMCNAVARFAPRTIWRINSQQLVAVSSSAVPNPDLAVLGKVRSTFQKKKEQKKLGLNTFFLHRLMGLFPAYSQSIPRYSTILLDYFFKPIQSSFFARRSIFPSASNLLTVRCTSAAAEQFQGWAEKDC